MSESDELAYLPICGPCIRGEGSECHTPGCALWLRDVPPDGLISEVALDLSEIRREGAVDAWDEGYSAARTMAHCWGHTDHWENEPDNPYRATAFGGET